MRRVAVVVAVITALYTLRCVVLPRILPPGDVDYRGNRIMLSKWYFDYDDYKNDPENIAPYERTRVESLVVSAPIDRTFANRMEMLKAISALRFPGYGSSQFGEKPQADGTVLAGYSVEVPMANKERVLVFEGRGGLYTLVDDFVTSGDPLVSAVRQEGGHFVYSTRQGQELLRRRREKGGAAQQGDEADER